MIRTIQDIDYQTVTWLGSLNGNWTREVVDLCQVDVLDIIAICTNGKHNAIVFDWKRRYVLSLFPICAPVQSAHSMLKYVISSFGFVIRFTYRHILL